MVSPTVIHFIRHGQVHNPDGVFYGRSPGFPLTEVGCREAQAVARQLAAEPLAAVFSSPLLRARQTAEIILAPHRGLELRVSELLNEVHSPFDGRPVGELAARKWDMYTGIGPGYEQPADVLARARQFTTQVRESYPGQQVAAVTHGDVLALMILWAKGVPVTPESRQRFSALGLSGGYPRPASITRFTFHNTVGDKAPDFEYIEPDLGTGT
jgi:broad specificity phosphatase PhoE